MQIMNIPTRNIFETKRRRGCLRIHLGPCSMTILTADLQNLIRSYDTIRYIYVRSKADAMASLI